ncbi:carotenoid oxygenase family protein [Limnofasciculus baicalensis]|uniref:Carotenoid oxygenase family protein n=1 Tax=Limnofasciculus baicalensis BBK-W-15 TaxID=2699891 RepID=A0AAE3GLU2_9CYAN|nr:carotenoid oxygenase family protein [Limnofasciculus baicalensis]MCP2726935.1 carotenoid oxygenase family protein [Limnofasciculus baicalensis BBK-W-15]
MIDHFKSKESKEKEYLFSLSLYAWAGFQPNQFTDIYWNCWGTWPELLSKFIFEMYKDYKYRKISVKEILKNIQEGKSANLLRLHADRTSTPPKLTIEDYYHFPQGYFGNSPQFIPRPNTDDPTNGYIVCMVLYDIKAPSDGNAPYNPLVEKKCELWIFDGQNLSDGPRYRLSHPRLDMGVTIHTTWLSKLETPPPRTDYSVRKDYEDLVKKTGSEAIAILFNDDIYPHFEN